MKLEILNKCGEIYRNGTALYTFGCAVCGEHFLTIKSIFRHIECHYSSCDKNEQFLREDDQTCSEIETNDENVFGIKTETVPSLLIQENELKLENNLQLECRPAPSSSTTIAAKTDNNLFCNLLLQHESSATLCHICGKTFRDNERDKHLHNNSELRFDSIDDSKQDNNNCDDNNEADIKTNFICRKEEQLIDRNQIVVCDYCGKKMKKRSIREHLDIHSSVQKFSCTICNKKIQTRSGLKSHERTHRQKKRKEEAEPEVKDDIKNYNCDICGWMFRDRCNLMVHIRRHKGEKPFKCPVCDKGFSQSSYINIHMRTHTGEKPYKCDTCGASFKGNSALHFHIRIKHTKTRPFKCGVCERTFTHSRSLREHYRTHTGERPYSCTVCSNSFSRRNAYEQHILLHTGIKSYKCKYCDMTFSQFAGRASHVKTAHKR